MTDSRKIGSALVAIMNDVKAIGKDSSNSSQGFKFRGIDAVMNNLHPIFAKNGVVIMPEVLTNVVDERTTKSGATMIHRTMTIRYTFVAEDESSMGCTVIGEAMDTGDKSGAKCMAIALKYALSQSLLLPYDEIDPDGELHEVGEKKEQKHDQKPAGDKKAFNKDGYTPKDEPISKPQLKLIMARSANSGMTKEVLVEMLKNRFGVQSKETIMKPMMDTILDTIDNYKVGDTFVDDNTQNPAPSDDDMPF